MSDKGHIWKKAGKKQGYTELNNGYKVRFSDVRYENEVCDLDIRSSLLIS